MKIKEKLLRLSMDKCREFGMDKMLITARVENDQSNGLIKKCGGPYDGKLDLPGGTIEFCERPEVALKRELLEETGLEIKEYDKFTHYAKTFFLHQGSLYAHNSDSGVDILILPYTFYHDVRDL